jgi:histone H3/H4
MADFRKLAKNVLEESVDQDIEEDAVDKMAEMMREYVNDLADRSSRMTKSIHKKTLEGKDIEAAARVKSLQDRRK